jgi:hypothetical protein
MDYPGVTEVIQVGLTEREQYIHRLGTWLQWAQLGLWLRPSTVAACVLPRPHLSFSSDLTSSSLVYISPIHPPPAGRTARAGREGAGLLILADWEAPCLLPDLADLPLEPSGAGSDITGGASAGLQGHPAAARGGASSAAAPGRKGLPTKAEGAAFLGRFRSAPSAPVPPFAPLQAVLAAVPRSGELSREAAQAYAASLGFYNSSLRRLGWDKPTLVATMNALWLTMGCETVPAIPRDTLGECEVARAPG